MIDHFEIPLSSEVPFKKYNLWFAKVFEKHFHFIFEGCASTIGGGGDRGKASADKGTGTEDLGFFVHRNVESERFRSTESLYSNVYGTNGGPKANFQTR
jgi:hypothetical protein